MELGEKRNQLRVPAPIFQNYVSAKTTYIKPKVVKPIRQKMIILLTVHHKAKVQARAHCLVEEEHRQHRALSACEDLPTSANFVIEVPNPGTNCGNLLVKMV